MPLTSTINARGQITIPKAIRDSLGLVPKNKLYYALLSDGSVIIRTKKLSIASLAEMLNDHSKKPVTIEEMNLT